MYRRHLATIGIFVCFHLLSTIRASAQYAAGNTHFYYVDTSQHVEALTLTRTGYGNWSDITAATGAPATASLGAALTGFADGVGDHVFYRGSNQHLYQLYYCGQNCVPLDTWISQDITSMAGGAPLLASGTNLSAFISSSQEHVIYLGTNQHVYQVVTTSSGTWTYQDLTATTGGAVAASGSALASFNDSVGQHVFYLGTNSHVYQLYYAYNTRTWADQDLTVQTGGALAASGSALTSFADSQEHVVYEGTNQHVYQLVTHPGGWLEDDLSSLSGGSLPVQSSSLSSFADGGYEFVFYTGPCVQDGQSTLCPVSELIYNGSAWSHYSLPDAGATGTHLASVGVSNVNDLLTFSADCTSCGATIVATDTLGGNGTYTWNGIQTCCDDAQPTYPQTWFVIFIDP
jgi:hypothetical protein